VFIKESLGIVINNFNALKESIEPTPSIPARKGDILGKLVKFKCPELKVTDS
jgi:hypothetical protein